MSRHITRQDKITYNHSSTRDDSYARKIMVLLVVSWETGKTEKMMENLGKTRRRRKIGRTQGRFATGPGRWKGEK